MNSQDSPSFQAPRLDSEIAEHESSLGNESTHSSAQNSRPGSRPPNDRRSTREKYRVHFRPPEESVDTLRATSPIGASQNQDVNEFRLKSPPSKPLPGSRIHSNNVPRAVTDSLTDIVDLPARNPVSMPRSILIRPSSDSPDLEDIAEDLYDDESNSPNEKGKGRASSQKLAQDRAARMARTVKSNSAPCSKLPSPTQPSFQLVTDSPPSSTSDTQLNSLPFHPEDIPMKKFEKKRKYGIEDDSDEEENDEDGTAFQNKASDQGNHSSTYSIAEKLVRNFKEKAIKRLTGAGAAASGLQSGQVTPLEERDPDVYVPPPKAYRAGITSTLWKHYSEEGIGAVIGDMAGGLTGHRLGHRRSRSSPTAIGTPEAFQFASAPTSGTTTPKIKHQKWYYKTDNSMSTSSIANLVNSSNTLAQPASQSTTPSRDPLVPTRPQNKRNSTLESVLHPIDTVKRNARLDAEIRITVHIAEILSRHRYLQKLCRALMTYGAPTHRLEEYMRMSARVLEIDGQFLYLPGCMIMSFDDNQSHTTEVKIVRVAQGIDLGKLLDVYFIYKEVVHDKVGVDTAMQRLEDITKRKQTHPAWVLIIAYGFASAFVGPFAFGARPIDLPISFCLGCILGILQLLVAPRSELYSNVFEITAVILTSFLARAFGSIGGGKYFCFAALAQSSIVMILPGYIVLCGSLELQTRNLVAGSVRMVYAIIYSLFLGFGITVGTSIYGAIDRSATTEVTCRNPLPFVFYPYLFVPPFTLCLIIINQATRKQTPVMLCVAFVGYVVNHVSALRFTGNAQIANTLGALAIGVLGNLYSRMAHGLAAAALLPAIFVQVPSGLAASGSLVSGVRSANQITNQTHTLINGTKVAINSTMGGGTTISSAANGEDVNNAVFNVGYSMIQIAIGITVGLFLSALVVYPLGKRRSGLFSF